MATMLMYLSDVEEGGETSFPDGEWIDGGGPPPDRAPAPVRATARLCGPRRATRSSSTASTRRATSIPRRCTAGVQSSGARSGALPCGPQRAHRRIWAGHSGAGTAGPVSGHTGVPPRVPAHGAERDVHRACEAGGALRHAHDGGQLHAVLRPVQRRRLVQGPRRGRPPSGRPSGMSVGLLQWMAPEEGRGGGPRAGPERGPAHPRSGAAGSAHAPHRRRGPLRLHRRRLSALGSGGGRLPSNFVSRWLWRFVLCCWW